MAGRWHPMRVLAWLLATACAVHAGEATEAASGTTDQFKLLIGSVLMSDYIFRGISYSAHQPAVGAYVDAQQGWLYVYTNFNSVRFSTNPTGELTMAAGARSTLGPFEFDIGAEYYYYPGEIGPEHSNYWEAHATVSHKLTDKSPGDRRWPTRPTSGRPARGALTRPARSRSICRANSFPPR